MSLVKTKHAEFFRDGSYNMKISWMPVTIGNSPFWYVGKKASGVSILNTSKNLDGFISKEDFDTEIFNERKMSVIKSPSNYIFEFQSVEEISKIIGVNGLNAMLLSYYLTIKYNGVIITSLPYKDRENKLLVSILKDGDYIDEVIKEVQIILLSTTNITQYLYSCINKAQNVCEEYNLATPNTMDIDDDMCSFHCTPQKLFVTREETKPIDDVCERIDSTSFFRQPLFCSFNSMVQKEPRQTKITDFFPKKKKEVLVPFYAGSFDDSCGGALEDEVDSMIF